MTSQLTFLTSILGDAHVPDKGQSGVLSMRNYSRSRRNLSFYFGPPPPLGYLVPITVEPHCNELSPRSLRAVACGWEHAHSVVTVAKEWLYSQD